MSAADRCLIAFKFLLDFYDYQRHIIFKFIQVLLKPLQCV